MVNQPILERKNDFKRAVTWEFFNTDLALIAPAGGCFENGIKFGPRLLRSNSVLRQANGFGMPKIDVKPHSFLFQTYAAIYFQNLKNNEPFYFGSCAESPYAST